jgi:two-component system response regulator AtoC
VITSSLKQALLLYQWPGNVRELENLVRKFVILRDPELIAAELNAKSTRKPLLSNQVLSPSPDEPGANEATILEQSLVFGLREPQP